MSNKNVRSTFLHGAESERMVYILECAIVVALCAVKRLINVCMVLPTQVTTTETHILNERGSYITERYRTEGFSHKNLRALHTGMEHANKT